jgi:CelD/BcsL family acetyltransferase involved in cellulose biosynthesis
MIKEPIIVSEFITLQISNGFDELSSMQQEWDDFIESLNGGIFMTYDWLKIWWNYYGKNRRLRIFIFRFNDTIIAILPTFFETIRIGPLSIKVVKIVGSDFMPVSLSIPINEKFIDIIISKFIHHLPKLFNFDMIYLGAICGICDITENLLTSLKKNLLDNYTIEKKESDVQTYIKVFDNFEEYTSNINKRERRKIRRKFRGIKKLNLSLESRFASNDTFSHFFESFIETHQVKWKKEGRTGHFVAWPLSHEFHKEVAFRQLHLNRLRLQQISLNDRAFGYIYAYKFGNMYFAYLDARKDSELSYHVPFYRIAFTELIKEAIKENIRWIDLGRGRYEHKLHLGGNLFPINDIFICSNKLISQIRVKSFRSFAGLFHFYYFKLWRTRIAPTLKVKHMPLCKLWIRSHMLSN